MTKILFGIALIFVFSCKKKGIDLDMGYDYFPIDSGKTIVYKVTDIFHDIDLIPQHDTAIYQIKEVIGESFIDDEGEPVSKLFRYFREDESVEWAIKDVWVIKRTISTAEVIEENQRFLKLAFGVFNNKEWNLNVFNNLEKKSCTYARIGRPFATENFSFENTCIVNCESFISFIDHRRIYHVYAKNIGCVYSVKKDLTINNFDTLDIKKGTEIVYEIIDYSHE